MASEDSNVDLNKDFSWTTRAEELMMKADDLIVKVDEKDNVNHPSHYEKSCSLECIDVMEAMFGSEYLIIFCLMNSFKYLWRHKNKNGKEDLDKASWYLIKATSTLDYLKVKWSADDSFDYDLQDWAESMIQRLALLMAVCKEKLSKEGE